MDQWLSLFLGILGPLTFGGLINSYAKIASMQTEINNMQGKIKTLEADSKAHEALNARLVITETMIPYIVNSTKETRDLCIDVQKSIQRMELAIVRLEGRA